MGELSHQDVRVPPCHEILSSVDMTHIKIIQHRLSNLLDSDKDGIFSEEV